MLIRQMNPEENLITLAEAAKLLEMAPATLKKRICTGHTPLRPIRFGHRTVRYIEADVWALRARIIAQK